MNKKTQVDAIREVFQFGIGIIFLIGVFYFLYNTLIPQIETYALNLQLENIAEHVNYIISELYKSSSQSLVSSTENKYLMPENVGDYPYFVYLSDEELCSGIKDLNLEKCTPLLLDSRYQGIFFSGGEIKIIITYTETDSLINIGN
ncbi:MAG: hypothetical protein PHN56_05525 [Candidatus Nanoarchaeia archaeon]|nr:hypothetical protein [Candidatus Nanoarchaeia archaeon]